jgi:tetraacyldisaccharide 4'-kinase
MKHLDYYWYTRSPWLVLLTPVSLVFRMAVRLRRLAYQSGLGRSHRLAVPVIVVGNITVGGTGKTPLVAWLANYLKERGFRPGIVSRGYGGRATSWPQQVRPDSDPGIVGDEAVLLAGLTTCPMAVAPKRVVAARALLENSQCDVILSDDGLQHYALQRDVEIAVIDGIRRFGTGFMLPAGPLREPVKRLEEVDLVVVNGLGSGREHQMRVTLGDARSLLDENTSRELTAFRGQSVHAVAGIGNPERFFQSLQQAGMVLERHVFPDHHHYVQSDMEFGDNNPVIMTGKDAVKCREFASDRHWYVPLSVHLPPAFCERLDELLDARCTINHESA